MKYLDKDATLDYLGTRWPRFLFKPHAKIVGEKFEVQCPLVTMHVHGLSYLLCVVDDGKVNESVLYKALLRLPTFFSIHRVDKNDLAPFKELGGTWQGFLFPQDPTAYQIIVVDGDKRGCQWNGGTIGNGCSVAYRSYDTPATLGVRIWHELLHTLRLPADDMLVDEGFLSWLVPQIRVAFEENKKALQHDAHMQTLYYTYLMERM